MIDQPAGAHERKRGRTGRIVIIRAAALATNDCALVCNVTRRTQVNTNSGRTADPIFPAKAAAAALCLRFMPTGQGQLPTICHD
jgi:hypothetical protein